MEPSPPQGAVEWIATATDASGAINVLETKTGKNQDEGRSLALN